MMKNNGCLKYIISLLSLMIFILGFLSYHYMICLLIILLYACFLIDYIKREKNIEYLIECSDKIIDHHQKHIEIIDGEGHFSLLSHKLYILNERFYTLLDEMKAERLKLKDYVEDISHQLKTPITSMKINEEILLQKVQDEHQKQLIEKIYIQTNHMNDLVESLLRLAKVESQSIQYDLKKYPFHQIMDHVEDILAPMIIENDIEFVYHFSDEMIICDFDWMSEAIENIIKNCIEASPGLPIDVYIHQTQMFTNIKICDHGQGFDEEDLPHVLERFYKGKRASQKSVGIGLALSQEIIKGHYGYLEVSNEQGAVFTIHLPIFLMKKKYE